MYNMWFGTEQESIKIHYSRILTTARYGQVIATIYGRCRPLFVLVVIIYIFEMQFEVRGFSMFGSAVSLVSPSASSCTHLKTYSHSTDHVISYKIKCRHDRRRRRRAPCGGAYCVRLRRRRGNKGGTKEKKEKENDSPSELRCIGGRPKRLERAILLGWKAAAAVAVSSPVHRPHGPTVTRV